MSSAVDLRNIQKPVKSSEKKKLMQAFVFYKKKLDGIITQKAIVFNIFMFIF